ncbi:MAG: aminomethyl-transferring glycine dehydrogenase [Verrucomicrobiales bacterium]|nr:aminomethyl-transferring glycine dehydrogenase [Verrucomicrobiales bacterium]
MRSRDFSIQLRIRKFFPDLGSPFLDRHLGVLSHEEEAMLSTLGYDSIDALVADVVPAQLLEEKPLDLPEPFTEYNALAKLRGYMEKNVVATSMIGRGYYDTITPPVIQRTILENPGWYTAYTPYQAEISQGRLEALLNFQTLICELTSLPVANASLLDEGTAAAEALAMAAAARPKGSVFLVSDQCFSQTIAILETRAEPLGIELVIGPVDDFDFAGRSEELIGMLLQYPGGSGAIDSHEDAVSRCRESGGVVIVAADLLALTLLKPPGEWGADIVVGSAQRFGVPMGFGGPHAAFLACADAMKRRLPGRLVGVSKDADGRPALRLSLQTREQHIRREKATSNICTAQVLLAVMAGFYAVYHGPEGLKRIAGEIYSATSSIAEALKKGGYEVSNESWFDTLTVALSGERREAVIARALEAGLNLRLDEEDRVGISLDEVSVECGDWKKLFTVFELGEVSETDSFGIPDGLKRESTFLSQSVFHRFRSETEILRYIRRLEGKDIALNWSMIPLGSCTMKLNASSEMLPLSWPEVGRIHPFAPANQVTGYDTMISELSDWLAEITGFDAVSVQPNAGSQGEYAGLLAIRRFHQSKGETDRKVCLIPMSAHGTNPASAVMAGFEVVPVACDSDGNIDLEDITAKAGLHAARLGALMITYPSTHGVFEETVDQICELIHENGGQVYMDGANMNAQVGLCSPGSIGADVCHLNLHKTFCIPHGGGGPGVGPIGVAAHLTPFLPGHRDCNENQEAPVSAAPFGSASILTISWMYIAMTGSRLRKATEIAILNANYIAAQVRDCYPVLYKGKKGLVAHECIIDVRPLKERAGVDVEDIAKRLIDYGFHAPTMSWPVPGTLMIEPTESESKEELDRFCEAMISIYREVEAIESGEWNETINPLKCAPHPAETLLAASWDRSYSPESAAYPLDWVRERKFWPPVSRIDNVFGDRNLVCTCDGMDTYEA